MELLLAIENRFSARHFKSDPVPKEVLEEMVRSAALAPSINNSQPYKFLAITNKKIINQIADVIHAKIEAIFPTTDEKEIERIKLAVDISSTFFVNAPAIILVLSQPYEAVIDKIATKINLTHDEINKIRNYPNVQSIGAAVQNLLLTAVDLDYAGCWITGLLIAREEIENLLEIKSPFTIAACIAVGKSSTEKPIKEKKSFNEIFEIIE